MWDGRLEFLGRRDEQVKVNGHRVEPGEVEACLGSYPGVREACVTTRRDSSGTQRLVGYVVPASRDMDRNDLRSFLQRRLPAPMLPSDLVILETLPRTASGKVDRRRLPPGSPLSAAAGRVREHCAPRTPEEARLARMWQEVLGVGPVGIHDNFFDLGGHSLLATQLASRIRESFSVEVSLRRIFEAPSVALLAEAIARETQIDRAEPEIMPAPREHRSARPAPVRYDA